MRTVWSIVVSFTDLIINKRQSIDDKVDPLTAPTSFCHIFSPSTNWNLKHTQAIEWVDNEAFQRQHFF